MSARGVGAARAKAVRARGALSRHTTSSLAQRFSGCDLLWKWLWGKGLEPLMTPIFAELKLWREDRSYSPAMSRRL